MEILDRIMEMQKQGISENQIYAQLQQEGISPQKINVALNQAKVKNAVSSPEPQDQSPSMPNNQGMQPSMMSNETQPPAMTPPQPQTQNPSIPNNQETPQITQSQPPAPEVYPPQPQQDYYNYDQAPQQDYYTQSPQAYSQQDYYAPQTGMDAETIAEIAEQVTTEKLNEYQRKVGDITAFKNKIQDQVDNIDDRLKRIEASIDKLQQAIIGKIGEFGENNAAIHQDLENLHGTVSKLMNPLIDNINEMKNNS